MVRKECPTCGHSWSDVYGKNECPKCLKPLSGSVSSPKRAPGEASTFKAAPNDARESSGGVCSKADGGPHTFRFGKCSACAAPEPTKLPKAAECTSSANGKHMFKFGQCACGKKQF